MKNFSLSPKTIVFLAIFFLSFGGTSLLASLASTVSPVFCQETSPPAAEYGWEITKMDVAAQITEKGEMIVQEKILANFSAPKHGIYRTIPLLFEPKGDGYKPAYFAPISVSDITVTQDGQPANVTTSVRQGMLCPLSLLAGEYNKEKFIKIGDPDAKISGQHEYVISYVVKNAIRNDRGYPEIYWNLVGHGWGVTIAEARIRLTKSGQMGFDTNSVYCYSGLAGSTDTTSCSTFLVDEGTIDFAMAMLKPYHGVTVQTAIKKEFASQILANTTGDRDRSFEYLLGKWYYLLAFAPFVYFTYIWNKNGRDPDTRGIIAPRFDAPSNMSPAQAGVVLDQAVDNVDIAAIIISIAQKGAMRITHKPGGILGIGEDYIFEKSTVDVSKNLTEEERHIFDNLFAARLTATPLSTLKDHFHLVVNEAKAKLYAWSVVNGYFKKNPGPFQSELVPGYILIAIFWFFAITNSSFFMIVLIALSTVFSFLLLYFYRFYTSKGKSAQEEILGLKMYMSTAEKDRIEFHNAPEKSPELFERLLPYAMALGVVKIWADKFASLNMQPPTWYAGSYAHFNAAVFANDLSRASSSFSSVMTSVPSSSGSGGGGGGGFSGGGGGGGGGGSW